MSGTKTRRARFYISGAITGTDNYVERFATAEAELTERGYFAVNPVKLNKILPEDTTCDEYMKMDFALLDMCDAVYMLEGWEKSCGANREYGYAMAKDMMIIKEEAK